MQHLGEKLDAMVRALFPQVVQFALKRQPVYQNNWPRYEKSGPCHEMFQSTRASDREVRRANGCLDFFLLTRLMSGVGGLAIIPPLVVTLGWNRTAWLLVISGFLAQIGAAVLATAEKSRFEFAYALSFAGFASALSAWFGPIGLIALVPCVLEAGLMLNRRFAFATGVMIAATAGLTFLTGDGPSAINPLGFAGFMAPFLFALSATGIGVEAMLYRLEMIGLASQRVQRSGAALIEAVDRGIATVDAKGEIYEPSATLIQMTGLPHHELANGQFFERIHLLSRAAYLKAISDALHSDRPVKTQIKVKCRIEGDTALYRDFDMTLRGTYRDDPRDERFAIISLGETRRDNILSHQLRDPLYEAQLRHELKTPLNAIIGFAELLSNPAIVPEGDPRRHDYSRIIAISARHLVDILDHMKAAADSGEADAITDEAVEVDELVREALSMLKLSAEAQHVIIESQIEEGLPQLFGQRHGLRQIIINLVSNAVKFSPDGRVVIAAARHHAGVQLSVSDDGIGMADQELMRVGEPYFRGSASASGFDEGEGLGLAVVRGLVERHRGEFSIESAPGNGTTARVVFSHVRANALSTLHELAAIDAGQSPLPVSLTSRETWSRKIA